MSVIAEVDGDLMGIVKGSPEMVKQLSVKDSLPADFEESLGNYTSQGYRILALAYRELRSKEAKREDVERDLLFLGFLVVQNKMKAETPVAISKLKAANIRCIMATGDNVLTAITVGKHCKLVYNNVPLIIGDVDEDGHP